MALVTWRQCHVRYEVMAPPFSWRYGHQNEPNFGPRGGLAAEPHPPQILLGFASSTLANQRLPLIAGRVDYSITAIVLGEDTEGFGLEEPRLPD